MNRSPLVYRSTCVSAVSACRRTREENAHALRPSGRALTQGSMPVFVAQLPYADAYTASPRSVPQISEFDEKSRGKKY